MSTKNKFEILLLLNEAKEERENSKWSYCQIFLCSVAKLVRKSPNRGLSALFFGDILHFLVDEWFLFRRSGSSYSDGDANVNNQKKF